MILLISVWSFPSLRASQHHSHTSRLVHTYPAFVTDAPASLLRKLSVSCDAFGTSTIAAVAADQMVVVAAGASRQALSATSGEAGHEKSRGASALRHYVTPA